MIDLRSDTVTRPSAAMLDAMMNAATGDDVYRDDPTVNALEAEAAATSGSDKRQSGRAVLSYRHPG